MTLRGEHPSELAWAKHLSREGGWLARRRIRRHLAHCPDCKAREAEWVREREAFERGPLLPLTRAAARPPVGGRVAWRWLVLGGAAGTLATAVALVLALRVPTTGGLEEKGAEVFTLYLRSAEGAATLGGECAPGDRLMAGYRTRRPYLLILERDGRGAVQVLFPPGGRASGRVPEGEGVTPTSWILDAAEGRECFAAFFSDEPVSAGVAAAALAATPQGPSLPGAAVRVRCCEKGGGR